MPRSFAGIGHIVAAIGNASDGLSFHDLAAIIVHITPIVSCAYYCNPKTYILPAM
jgi:hypothetical protein